MNTRTTRRARLASLTGTAALALTLGLAGQLFAVSSAAAAGADDTARLPRVSAARPQVELTGAITAMDAGTITIDGQTVAIGTAEVTGQLALGAVVKVHASVALDGTLQAREVRVLSLPAAAPQTPTPPPALVVDDHGQDGATHDAGDDHGQDGATHDTIDDKGQDGATHDATDDKGQDGATHDTIDDHGQDGATHDTTDDKGGATGSNTGGNTAGDDKGGNKGGGDKSGRGGKDDGGKHE